jgi:hypothetical protein
MTIYDASVTRHSVRLFHMQDRASRAERRLTLSHFDAVSRESVDRQIAALRWACEHDASVDEMHRWIVAQGEA